MTTTLGVFGLGYVGCVSAACFAKAGWRVIGVDVNGTKVDMINQGTSPVLEPGLPDLLREQVAAGRLRATSNVAEAVAEAALSLICVGTPSKPNGAIDSTYVERVCEDIGRALRGRPGRHVVVVRSTVVPGTVDTVVKPTLERAAQRALGDTLAVCVNPEFLREGTSLKDFYNPPFTLIGSDDPSAAKEVAALYTSVPAPVQIVDTKAAEIVKYACNAFHGLKVSFANEIGNVCRALGIDSREVMRVFCEDTKLNLSAYYLKPGFAFGGSCLPKDLRALVHRARQLDVETPVLAAVLQSNRMQVERAVDMVLRTGKRRVGMLGLTFKPGTDDLRESPLVTLAETLLGKGMQLAIYDPDVSAARVMGANRAYIEREIPHIWSLMRDSLPDVVEHAETIVIGNKLEDYRRVETLRRDGQVLIDLVRMFDRRSGEDDGRYQGICW
ncbi:MAG: GDP-mannose dehydrogenase [Gemmatimonadetes bacterium]|nr:MAG: GDP-mannose dehydrogenase [Gemmatimonadota bacterium]